MVLSGLESRGKLSFFEVRRVTYGSRQECLDCCRDVLDTMLLLMGFVSNHPAECMRSLYERVMPNPDLAQDDRMGLAT